MRLACQGDEALVFIAHACQVGDDVLLFDRSGLNRGKPALRFAPGCENDLRFSLVRHLHASLGRAVLHSPPARMMPHAAPARLGYSRKTGALDGMISRPRAA
jgi:hypothetical protein